MLDVRERDAYEAGHIPGARLLPRGQLELRVNEELPDPTRRIVTCCEFGRISTLAAATLRAMGFQRAVALDGGMKAWREAGYPLKPGRSHASGDTKPAVLRDFFAFANSSAAATERRPHSRNCSLSSRTSTGTV